jgi:hypothetical protein
VLASIEHVQDMLRDDAGDVAEMPTQVSRIAQPLVVAEPLIGGVPSAAEIAASRAARWGEDAAAVRVVSGRRGRWLKVGLGSAALLALFAGGGFVLGQHLSEPAAPVGLPVLSVERALTDEVARVHAQALEAEVGRLSRSLSGERAARTKAEALAEEQQAAQTAREAAAAKALSTVKVEARARKPRKKLRRRSTSRSSLIKRRTRTKKRRARPASRQDKRLDSLIDGL